MNSSDGSQGGSGDYIRSETINAEHTAIETGLVVTKEPANCTAALDAGDSCVSQHPASVGFTQNRFGISSVNENYLADFCNVI